jgi:hypothetical protein
MGVRITHAQNEKLAKTPLESIINGREVYLASNTSVSDYVAADYVLSQSEEMGCTLPDFFHFQEQVLNQKMEAFEVSNSVEVDPDNDIVAGENNCADGPGFAGYRQSSKFLSPIARRLQSEIEESHQSDAWSPSHRTLTGEYELITEDSKDEVRKRIITSLDGVLSSSRMPAVYIERFETGVMRMIPTLDADIAAFKMQLFEELKEKSSIMNSDERTTDYEFACDEKKSNHKEKRKRNGLDY